MDEYCVRAPRDSVAGSGKKERFFIRVSRKCLVDYYSGHDREAVLRVMDTDVMWFGPLAHLHGTGVSSLRVQFEASPNPIIDIAHERWSARLVGDAWLVVGMAALSIQSMSESEPVLCLQNVTFVWEKRGCEHRISHIHISTAHSADVQEFPGGQRLQLQNIKSTASLESVMGPTASTASSAGIDANSFTQSTVAEFFTPPTPSAALSYAVSTLSLLPEATSHEQCERFIVGGKTKSGLAGKLWIEIGEGQYFQIVERNIVSVEACGRYCRAVCTDNVFEAREAISRIEENLSHRFVRIHRSYLINVEHVAAYGRFYIQMSNGQKYPVPERRYTSVRAEIKSKLEKQ